MCGGPYDEVGVILDLLERLDLVREGTRGLARRPAGDAVVRAARNRDYRPFGLVLIRGGHLANQARALIEAGSLDADRNLICETRPARSLGAQLIGILDWWPEVKLLPRVFVPAALAAELDTVWALLPPVVDVGDGAAERKAVGNRAEMYTVQMERSQSLDPSAILWVARDSDSLGWDVEDRAATLVRHIEVKGRRDDDVIFFLSENEWKKAQQLGPTYEVHFWGGIDLSRTPASEYATLRAAGYPLVIREACTAIAGPGFELRPVKWRVTKN